uniref:RNase H type-1 domain-containing protein n=1 Tax=Triticum urartu TaxID=4572 RepID=A0A8R7TEY3_TRIUA
MCYDVYFTSKKQKQYFQENVITMVSTAPLGDIIRCRNASGRVAKWALELAGHTILYEPCTTIKSQDLADFLVDWTETQYLPPQPDSTHWRMHFDGSKMQPGLGAGIVLFSPKGDRLKYALQIHFAASNNVTEYEALVHGLRPAKELGIRCILCYGDSDLVVQQCSGEWDAHDSNMASYRFLVQKLSGFFEGCEFLHVPRVENEAADTLAKITSSWQSTLSGVSLEHLHKPSV